MITIRNAEERGHVRYDWLDTYHTFSFGEYYDPRHMGISNLRVINDDTIAPSGGFPTHGHRDMEIITYVLSGALEHKDSLGNGSVIRPGDVQRMSAGTGILHSEFNPSATEPLHLLQIWLQPNRSGVRPGYEQKFFSAEEKRGRFKLLASPDGRDGSLTAHQDASLSSVVLESGEAADYALAMGRQAYVQVARGTVSINGQTLKTGDGAWVANEPQVRIEGLADAEVLLFDLP
ncbi:MAG: pirin family protein [Gammaproteobacteria bacterium]|nr:pirin family protein [Gammaproteobacteria bacterium]MCP5424722.1 pirin family protein [Gammaproteobacteria bacterium]MCP5459243.1 pirin family protein [Gammaproteobacteria bacterium]